MMEQMDLFSDITEEKQVYEILKPYLAEALEKNNAGSEKNLNEENGKSYTSVNYAKFDPYDPSKDPTSNLVFRICLRKGKHHFGVSKKYLIGLNYDSFQLAKVRKEPGFMNFDFVPTQDGILKYKDFLASVLENYTYSIQKDFDCCYRFEQCSDAKRCIHPKSAMATSCGYRKILRDGKIFYGKNRNVE